MDRTGSACAHFVISSRSSCRPCCMCNTAFKNASSVIIVMVFFYFKLFVLYILPFNNKDGNENYRNERTQYSNKIKTIYY